VKNACLALVTIAALPVAGAQQPASRQDSSGTAKPREPEVAAPQMRKVVP